MKKYNTISKKFIVNYITEQYGTFKHNIDDFIRAIRETSKEYKLNKKDLFHYIIERASTISGTQSYGFDTAYGREIRQTFEANYYSQN